MKDVSPVEDRKKPPSAPITPDPIPEGAGEEEEVDYDSIGLTDAELEELLGDTPSSASDE